MNLFGFATAVNCIKYACLASAPSDVQTGAAIWVTVPNRNVNCYLKSDHIADKWPMKSNLATIGKQDLFNLIMHKKVTFRGLLAWPVITQPAMLMNSYIVSAQKLDKVLDRSGVIRVTG